MNSDPVLAVAIRAARRAASVLVDAARDLKRLPASSKRHGEIVASARTDAEDAIVATLRTAFPDHAVLGEESGHIPGAREGSGPRWLIGPLDGATNFAHGYPHYAVSVALLHGSRPTHAVVLDPVRDETFAAVHGESAQLNDTPVRVSWCTSLSDALVGAALPPPSSPMFAACAPAFDALLARCGATRRAGACSLDLCYVACGRLDGVVAAGVDACNAAAGALIVEEAGGRVGDFAGGGDIVRASQIIAAAPGVFDPLREAVVAAMARHA
jgi:myo-inositol-1(or 4)-monophosphatase